jgi:NADH:ubiquinone oxidoreductase subunit D
MNENNEILLNNYYLNFGPQHPAAHGVLKINIRIKWRVK